MKRLTLPLRIARPIVRYNIGTGIQRRISYMEEASPYVLAAGPVAGGQQLRRVTFGLALNKDGYASNEKASHQQDQDFRHGFRSARGPISGELSPGTYTDWKDALLRRARTAVAAISGASITIAASGDEYTITRAAGSFLTDGIKKGMVIRLTAGAFNANNLNKNIVVRLVTATVITGKPLSASLTLTAEGPIAAADITIPGYYSYVPTSGHTDKTFVIEDYHASVTGTPSEQFYGCKMNSMKVTVPSTGISTIDWDVLGMDMATSAAAYFSAPAAETTTGLVAASTGMLLAGDTEYTTLTNIDFTVSGNATSNAVVGSNKAPAIFVDKVQVVGNFSAFFEDVILRDAFLNESEMGVIIVLAESNEADAEFVSYMMPRCKLTSAGKDDPNTGIQQSIGFKALRNSAGGAGVATEQTTIAYQDSAAAAP